MDTLRNAMENDGLIAAPADEAAAPGKPLPEHYDLRVERSTTLFNGIDPDSLALNRILNCTISSIRIVRIYPDCVEIEIATSRQGLFASTQMFQLPRDETVALRRGGTVCLIEIGASKGVAFAILRFTADSP